MDPISIVLGLVSLGSAAVGFFKQKSEVDAAQAVADAELEKATKDNQIQRLNLDAEYISATLQAEADIATQNATVAQAALQRTQLEKRVFAGLALLLLAAATFIYFRNKQSIS